MIRNLYDADAAAQYVFAQKNMCDAGSVFRVNEYFAKQMTSDVTDDLIYTAMKSVFYTEIMKKKPKLWVAKYREL